MPGRYRSQPNCSERMGEPSLRPASHPIIVPPDDTEETEQLEPPPDTPLKINRALLSVSDPRGLSDFAQVLSDHGIELIASGGTAERLRNSGLSCTPATDLTGYPEILSGRVKTLHPAVFGALLADREQLSHREDLSTQGISPIDLVVVNFYPFADRPNIETIDIGGPALVRAAAKNHRWVAVVTHHDQYPLVADALVEHGELDLELRRELAREAFFATAEYDAQILDWLEPEPVFPLRRVLSLRRKRKLRYGENPHQAAAQYELTSTPPEIAAQRLHTGRKELSYNNVMDAETAWRQAHTYIDPAAVVVKHHSPCGVAVDTELSVALNKAWHADPLSAFGSVVALNRNLDLDTAQTLIDLGFVELLVVPGLLPKAQVWLTEHKSQLSIWEIPTMPFDPPEWRTCSNFWLAQIPDRISSSKDWEDTNGLPHTRKALCDLELAWKVAAFTKSNAVVLVSDQATVGIGAGQPSRVGAVKVALAAAGEKATGSVAASDGFFPFPDGLEALAEAGVVSVVAPCGSRRDEEMVKTAQRLGLGLWFSNYRHFRH